MAGPYPDLTLAAFSSSELSEMARITLRQLQWWDEREVLSPKREDRRRRVYLPKDVIGVMLIAELRRKGFSLQKIRRLVERYLRREIGKRVREILTGHSGLYVLTDGKSLSFEIRPDRIIALLKKAVQPMCLVSLDDLVKLVAEFQMRTASKRTQGQMPLF
jgi:DNA-binding transcriptional MerR regulator